MRCIPIRLLLLLALVVPGLSGPASASSTDFLDACRSSPLHAASWKGDVSRVESLLAQGAFADQPYGYTPLGCALHGNAMGVVKLLLEYGADPDQLTDYAFERPLDFAISKGSVDLVRLLLEAGADPMRSFFPTEKGGRPEIIELVAARAKRIDGGKALQTARSQKASGVVRALLRLGVELPASALHDAVRDGAREELESLLSAGLDANGRDMLGRTPLHAYGGCLGPGSGNASLRGGDAEIATALLERGADVNARDAGGRTALYCAAWLGYLERAELLLAHDARIEDADREGRTPLLEAVHGADRGRSSLEMVRLLLSRGADVNRASSRGVTPMVRALEVKAAPELLEALMAAGAHTDGARAGAVPLHVAVRAKNLGATRLLLSKGADVNARGEAGATVLHLAACLGDMELFRFLVDGGADVQARSSEGKTPLHEAAACGNVEVVTFLLDRGADLETRDNGGSTPFVSAVRAGRRDTAELLLDRGADVNAREKDGATALHWAADRGDPAMKAFLLLHGANPFARAGKEGVTAEQWEERRKKRRSGR